MAPTAHMFFPNLKDARTVQGDALPEYVQKHTFIDVVDHDAEQARVGLRRSRSTGDLPDSTLKASARGGESVEYAVLGPTSAWGTAPTSCSPLSTASTRISDAADDDQEDTTSSDAWDHAPSPSSPDSPKRGPRYCPRSASPSKSPRRRRRGSPDRHNFGGEASGLHACLATGLGELPASLEAAKTSDQVLAQGRRILDDCSLDATAVLLCLAARRVSCTPQGGNQYRSSDLLAVVGHLLALQPQLCSSQLAARLFWALGKLEARGPAVAGAVEQLAWTLLPALPHLTAQDLSNSFWGLARLADGNLHCLARAGAYSCEHLARAFATECSRRVSALPPQCLSNSLWATARLGLRGQEASTFAQRSAEDLCKGQRDISGFSAQALANVLWAAARLPAASGGLTLDMCKLLVAEAHGRLAEFQAQELSMLAWAVAKLHGRSGTGSGRRANRGRGAQPQPKKSGGVLLEEVFLVALAVEAQHRLGEFAPQGISNVAWALASREVLGSEAARSFLAAAAESATQRISEFTPQAISNLLWAVGRLGTNSAPGGNASLRTVVSMLAMAAAKEAAQRMSEFAWQDLSGIMVALSHGRHREPATKEFAILLLSRAAANCNELSTQEMLNIALSAARLGLPGRSLRPMVDAMDGCLHARANWLNPVDQRQWSEVQHLCRSRRR